MNRPYPRAVEAGPVSLDATDAYVHAPAGARLRIDEIAVRTRRLQLTFSGSFVTRAALDEAAQQAAEIEAAAKALGRVLR